MRNVCVLLAGAQLVAHDNRSRAARKVHRLYQPQVEILAGSSDTSHFLVTYQPARKVSITLKRDGNPVVGFDCVLRIRLDVKKGHTYPLR